MRSGRHPEDRHAATPELSPGTGRAPAHHLAFRSGHGDGSPHRGLSLGTCVVLAFGPGRGDASSHARRGLSLGTCAVLALLACEATPAPVSEPAPVIAAEAPAPAPAVTHALIPWLDPDAGSAVYTRVDARVDLEAVARLFAIPPRAAHMFRDLHAFDDGLAALMEGVAPAPATWLRAEALVYLPPIARGPYVVRGLSRPRVEVEAFLLAGGLKRDVMEGLVTFSPLPGDPDEPMAPDALPVHRAPAAAFPWRIVFLEDDVIGCYSLGEIGGGLGPLTAARDLPASELETRLTQEFAEDPEMVLDLVASGPTLSLDISDDVGAVRLGMRRWEHSGLDGELILHPLGDPDVATKELEARKPAGETDVVRELYDRIAFTPEPPVVRGRLQMTEADLRLLARGGG